MYDFTLRDVEFWSKQSHTNLESWKVRSDWFDTARDTFERNGVQVLHDLPLQDQYDLCMGADKVWKDDAA